MNLKKKKEDRLKALENAYNELIKVLNKKLDVNEVDPEKMKVSLSAYRQAADDSHAIYLQIVELVEQLEEKPQDKKEVKLFSGVEGRLQ